jgi:hypothetical protein
VLANAWLVEYLGIFKTRRLMRCCSATTRPNWRRR